jgi:hypothetical protein
MRQARATRPPTASVSSARATADIALQTRREMPLNGPRGRIECALDCSEGRVLRGLKAVFLALALSSTNIALACGTAYSKDEAEKTYPDGKSVLGDLNGDGVIDLAIHYAAQDSTSRYDRIVIFERQDSGKYCLNARSGRLEPGKTDIELANGSLFVLALSNTINESVRESFQFRKRNGRYVLIGFEESVDDVVEKSLRRDSRNYLTGKRIERTTKNGRTIEKAGAIKNDENALLPLEAFER